VCPESIQGPSNTNTHPYTIIFSLYADHAPGERSIWIGSLIQVLAALDVSAGTVRTIISRMQRDGLLQSRQEGRKSFYSLTDAGQEEVSMGAKQIFSISTEWDGRWTVITYSIPEKQRKKRDALRASLRNYGFGDLNPGLWISPHSLPVDAPPKWQEMGVWKYLEHFRAEHIGLGDPHKLVQKAWPKLPALDKDYRAYIARYQPVLRKFEAGLLDDQRCFAARLQNLFEFVSLNLNDPALPPVLLPKEWSRPSAQTLFRQINAEMNGPAQRFFDTICTEKER